MTGGTQYTFHIKQHPNQTIRGTLSFQGKADPLDVLFRSGNSEHPRDNDKDDESIINIIIPDPALNQSVETNDSTVQPMSDYDPFGAGSFVIAVVLIYGLSIVFLIASHVVVRKKEFFKDSEKQISRYLEQAPQLREESSRESFRNLKLSILPMIARSPSAGHMLTKSVKNAPYLMQSLPMTLFATTGVPHSKPIQQYPSGSMLVLNTTRPGHSPVNGDSLFHAIPQEHIEAKSALKDNQCKAKHICSPGENIVLLIDGDSGDDCQTKNQQASEENTLLYGGRSLQDILVDEELEDEIFNGDIETVI